ncbi:efflux RND transporter periplasmic adaptor subunit [Arthrobacter cavernae]|uniref:Efflux RND transporter periplasmic adaptor subunit n=1 Tax=Arthrobacter cavernae TaxID=2817681 RepID=A0A939KKY6_9MICC|nr:efflux RND transporter periplasmic adaptor subunit [Arthrobacter cavernae]MBO1266596.1 efflux RND transporter periplasmic adaptor subunit [Arthrobacter cavernae]
MGIFRRVILPVAWLLVFAVIAVALVKIAFVDGLKPVASEPGPMAQVDTPVVPAIRATVTNTVQIKATVQGDAAVAVRSTAVGKVVHIFLEPGAAVTKGDRLFQIATERQRQIAAVPSQTDRNQAGENQAPAKPVYDYFDVVAPADGKLQSLTVLEDQQLSVGETVGKVDPGTFTVSGPVNAGQQYRLLGKPGSAEISLVGGPAPFQCAAVTLKNNASDDGGSSTPAGGPGGVGMSVPGISAPAAVAIPGPGAGAPQDGGPATGTLSCAIPSGTEVFAGLGATMTVSAGVATNVVTVPLTSVKGSVKEGLVWLAGAGAQGAAPEQRTVALGLNDGTKVEVVSGLAEGEQILEFVPGAPAQMQGPGMAGPGGAVYGPAGG